MARALSNAVMISRSTLRNERGAVIVYMAAVIAVLFAILVFSIDVGWMTLARNQGQAAVDASALAATAALRSFNYDGRQEDVVEMAGMLNAVNTIAGFPADIGASNIDYYLYSNGALTSISEDPLDKQYMQANAVRVEKRYRLPLMMGRLFGTASWDFTVAATAVLGGPACAEPDIPLTLINCTNEGTSLCSADVCNTEISISLTHQTNSNIDTSAFFDFVSVDDGRGDNSTAVECREFAKNGSGGRSLCRGEPIYLNNGAVASCLQALETRFNTSEVTPLEVVVPVIDMDCSTEPNGTYAVSRFARIAILDIEATGSPKYIKFIKLCATEIDGVPGGGLGCGLLAKHPILVQ